MKTKDRKNKVFDTVKTFRDIRERISQETYGMTFDQFKAFLTQTNKKADV